MSAALQDVLQALCNSFLYPEMIPLYPAILDPSDSLMVKEMVLLILYIGTHTHTYI